MKVKGRPHRSSEQGQFQNVSVLVSHWTVVELDKLAKELRLIFPKGHKITRSDVARWSFLATLLQQIYQSRETRWEVRQLTDHRLNNERSVLASSKETEGYTKGHLSIGPHNSLALAEAALKDYVEKYSYDCAVQRKDFICVAVDQDGEEILKKILARGGDNPKNIYDIMDMFDVEQWIGLTRDGLILRYLTTPEIFYPAHWPDRQAVRWWVNLSEEDQKDWPKVSYVSTYVFAHAFYSVVTYLAKAGMKPTEIGDLTFQEVRRQDEHGKGRILTHNIEINAAIEDKIDQLKICHVKSRLRNPGQYIFWDFLSGEMTAKLIKKLWNDATS
ncbi:MAG: hypothetical protein OXE94_07180 [Aestuariivita sp.]|nr:hypothetical protein [Aestuariivita sp.]MCY4202777.1 hypothetical protein [Aestuariivita sp.]